MLDLAEPSVPVIQKALFLRIDAPAKLGDPIIVLGFPNPKLQGKSVKLTTGSISSLRGLRDAPNKYQIDAAIQPGNSGGPIIDDNGHVVGVASSSVNPAVAVETSGSLPQNVNYAVKIDYLVPTIKATEGLWPLVAAIRPPEAKSDPEDLAKSAYLIQVEYE